MKCSWTEHDPVEIYEGVQECIDGALRDAKNSGHEPQVIGIGITNQRETTVVWDKHSGKPFHRAIVWHDSRTSNICHRLKDKLGSVVCHLMSYESLSIPNFNFFNCTPADKVNRTLIECSNGLQQSINTHRHSLWLVGVLRSFTKKIRTPGCLLVYEYKRNSSKNPQTLQYMSFCSWHKRVQEMNRFSGAVL